MPDSKPTIPGETPYTIHHWWLGLILCAIGFCYLFYVPWFMWLGWIVAGVLIAADDLYKHHRQKWEPDYLSPYNKIMLWFIQRWTPGLKE